MYIIYKLKKIYFFYNLPRQKTDISIQAVIETLYILDINTCFCYFSMKFW